MTWNDCEPKNGHFFMRQQTNNAGVKGTMVLGFIPEILNTSKIRKGFLKGAPLDEIWLMQFIITNVKKFKVPEEYQGWKADQLLCEKFNLKDMEEI